MQCQLGLASLADWTLRRLVNCFEAVQRNAWDHTSFLLASNSSAEVHPFDLNPYRKKKRYRKQSDTSQIEAVYRALKNREQNRAAE